MSKRHQGSWLFTARVGLVLAALLPLLRVRLALTRDDGHAYRLVRDCARSVVKLTGVRVTVAHVDRVPSNVPVMFVSNHVSLADAAVLLAALPFDVRFVANHIFAKYPFLGAAIRAASAHIVDRDSWRSRAECGQTMTESLSAGQSLLVFPEGGTSDDGRLRPFRRGAFQAAARTGRTIVPVAIRGTRDMFPSGTYVLANAPVSIEMLAPLAAIDGSRQAVADLTVRTAEAIRGHLHPA